MKRLSLFLAGILFLMAGECSGPAEMRFPISEPGTAPYDPRLVGAWYRISGNQSGMQGEMLSIQPHPNGFLIVDYGNMAFGRLDAADAGAFWTKRTAYASVVDGKTYYNSKLVDTLLVEKVVGERPIFSEASWFTPHPERGYWIVRAELIGEDRLILHYLAKDDVQSEERPGREIDCGKDCSFTVFDLSPEELTALIRDTPPDQLFTENFLIFGRLEGARPPDWPPKIY